MSQMPDGPLPAVARAIAELRRHVGAWRKVGERVALVPTMGALHDGHLELVRQGRARCRRTVVSIFVNPRQFAPSEDLARYPRTFEADLAQLAPLGTDAVKGHLTDAPYVVVVFAQAYGLAQGDDGAERQIKHYYVAESVGIAVGLFLASLTHAGLCALTHTPSPMAFLGTILERPRNERPYVVIPVGYPAQDATVPIHALEKKRLERIMVRK